MNTWEIIAGKLWQGNIFAAAAFAADCVITCSPLSELPALIGDVMQARPVHVLFPFLDEPKLPDMNNAIDVASMAAWQIRHDKKVLVHCNAGHNRSGLVCGLVMQLLGMKGVVATIKKVHPEALVNKTFADFLDMREVLSE